MLVTATAGGFDTDAAAGGAAMGTATAFAETEADPDTVPGGLGAAGFIVEPSDSGGPAFDVDFRRTA